MTVAESPGRHPLTAGQRALYDWVLAHCYRYGTPPTYRQVMAGCGFRSLNAVSSYLDALARKGWVVWCGPALGGRHFARGSYRPVGYDPARDRALLAECLPHLPPELAGRVRAALAGGGVTAAHGPGRRV